MWWGMDPILKCNLLGKIDIYCLSFRQPLPEIQASPSLSPVTPQYAAQSLELSKSDVTFFKVLAAHDPCTKLTSSVA
jgi:hypothetical protein